MKGLIYIAGVFRHPESPQLGINLNWEAKNELSSGSQSVVYKALGRSQDLAGGQDYFHNKSKAMFTFFTLIFLRVRWSFPQAT